MRRFVLNRKVDVNDFSGTGIVVWGIEFPDGACAYRWNSEFKTTIVADDVDTVIKIHGHDGATELVWIDDEDGLCHLPTWPDYKALKNPKVKP